MYLSELYQRRITRSSLEERHIRQRGQRAFRLESRQASRREPYPVQLISDIMSDAVKPARDAREVPEVIPAQDLTCRRGGLTLIKGSGASWNRTSDLSIISSFMIRDPEGGYQPLEG